MVTLLALSPIDCQDERGRQVRSVYSLEKSKSIKMGPLTFCWCLDLQVSNEEKERRRSKTGRMGGENKMRKEAGEFEQELKPLIAK